MLPKLFAALLIIGMGYVIASVPALQVVIVYLIPIFSFCILVVVVRALLKSGDDHDTRRPPREGI